MSIGDGRTPADGATAQREQVAQLAVHNAEAAALCVGDRPKAAAGVFEQVLAGCRATLGDDHVGTLTVAGNLAVARVAAGQRREGITLLVANLSDRVRVWGEEDPRTLTARDALAVAYRLAGAVDDALVVSVRVTGQRRRTLGATHPDTLTSAMGLIQAHAAAGDLDTAGAVLVATLTDAEGALGPGHPHTRALLDCGHGLGLLRDGSWAPR